MSSLKRVGRLALLASPLLMTSSNASFHVDIPELDLAINIFRSTIKGFHLYDIVYKLDECDQEVTKYFSLWIKSLDRYIGATSQYDYEQGTWYLTDTFGQSSYVVRSCYDAWVNMAHLWYSFYLRIDEFPTMALFTHDNILERYEDINRLGWASFMSVWNERWADMTFNVSRLIYTILLSEHFDRRMLDINEGGEIRDLEE